MILKQRTAALLLALPASLLAQSDAVPLGEGPWLFDNLEEQPIRVSVLARGLNEPFDMVFLPATGSATQPLGELLISERHQATIRHYKDGVLLPQPALDLGDNDSVDQLLDLALHPDFAANGYLYFTWIKRAPHPDGTDAYWATTALSRAHWDGTRLLDQTLLFEARAWSDTAVGASSRLQFLPDGTLLLGVSHRLEWAESQDPGSHLGKILRLNDDATVPPDNPYVGMEGALPEIYVVGVRSVRDLTIHPVSDAVWELENGPQGGDEVNILQAGRNYGWPLDARPLPSGNPQEGSEFFSPLPWVENSERPELAWQPSIRAASLMFYDGERFPQWQNNLFVGATLMGSVPGTGHLQRVVFNENGEARREMLLRELQQGIGTVAQGPDDLIYLLTDSAEAALLRLEPVDAVGLSTQEDGVELNTLLAFAASDCAACHRTASALVGPSYTAIAERYADNEENRTLLVERIIQGGAGVWGEVPMTPHALDTAIALSMVESILALGTGQESSAAVP